MTRQPNDKFMLRLPDGWRDVIKVRAARNRRSMNNEILEMIEPEVAKEMETETARP